MPKIAVILVDSRGSKFRSGDYGIKRFSFPNPPRHGHVDDRAEEEEHNELGQAALHGIILRRWLSSPSAFGTAGRGVAAQVVTAFEAATTLAADGAADLESTDEK